MAQIQAGNIMLEVEQIGDPSCPAVILIAGLGFQLIDWPLEFCERLAEGGFQVIRFDNRDVGLSQKLEERGIPDLETALAAKTSGSSPDMPYALTEMSKDVVALMDRLSLDQAHIVGMSMGGMIAQLLAIHYPERCLSLTSIMSSSGEPSVSAPDGAAMAAISGAPASQEMSDIVTFGLKVNATIGSPGYRWPKEDLIRHIEACFKRGYCPTGYLRQMGAVFSAPSRREDLKAVRLPTLVLHGTDDLLVPPSAGQDVAEHIPGARLELIDGMGHDLSPSLCAHLAGLLIPHLKTVCS
ncbi:MAG: alpha/beta fold hydrolase [Sneathiella sp.]